MKIITSVFIVAIGALSLSGCASSMKNPVQIDASLIEPQTYDYSFAGVDKDSLFIRARNHTATAFGDSNSVIRIQDQKDGIILGKGAVNWNLDTGSPLIPYIECTSSYDIRFMAKEGKARLQFELIQGAPVYSRCSGWGLPTPSGYEEIKRSFDQIALGFKNALSGSGALSSFSDF